MISEILNSQYEFASAKGEYQRALDFRNQYFAVKDSMFQERKSKDIVEMETQYKTREKDQEIAFLNQENELKAASLERNTFLIIGLLILLGLVIVVFNFLRYRAIQRAKSVLQEQKIRMREAQIKAVIDSQEQERKRFATDLHDGMGQLIAALQLNIQSMSQLNGDLNKRDELYANSTHLLKDVHKEIRNIAFNLMPQTLMNEGLVAAVEELIKRINSTNQLQIKLSVLDLSQRLGEVVEVSLYRIIQEFLSNIMKYSQASQVYLGLTQHEDELVLTIEDDGIGYDLSKFKNSQGNGWRNINTRLNLIKGEMEVDTQEGRKGSSILITINRENIISNRDQVATNTIA
jgi:signal transduction histidine kinase